jgi:hypothetical protein
MGTSQKKNIYHENTCSNYPQIFYFKFYSLEFHGKVSN